VANEDGSDERTLAQRKFPERFGWDWDTRPEWTADDQTLVIPLVNADGTADDVEKTVKYYISIYEKDLFGGAERVVPLSAQRFDELGHVGVLSDGSGVIMSAKAYGASFPQIWQLSRDGSVRTITNDLSDYRELSMRSDSKAFVTVQTQTLSRIWVKKPDSNRVTPITSGSSRYFDICWAPDGKILYASDASGIAEIFEIAANGSGLRQLTSQAQRNYGPAVSPDGRYVVFHSNRSGIFQIWRADRDGSNPKQLTFGATESNWASFTADGKWVVYQHHESGAAGGTWKVPVDGGAPVKVTRGFSIRPAMSPDGKWIAYWYNDGGSNSRWRLNAEPLDGAGPVRTFEVAATVQVRWDSLLRWTSDSRELAYVDHRGGFDNLWGQPLAGGAARQITNFDDSQVFSFDWLRDGSLAASRGVITSDVVLITDADR
jgi:Tol biopolymer transport system component